MKQIIPYGKQEISHKDINEVKKSLNSNFITGGEYVRKFEKSFKDYTGSNFAVTCSSGTAGIHIALESINLKKNDVVIIPAINFIAAANMSKKMGAKVILADVDPFTGQMTPENLLECIRINKLKKIKAFFSMYNGGNPLFVKEFFKIKKKYKCTFIEDACHALGGYYSIKNKSRVGDNKFSDISVFSFHPVKSITTGEGGMVTTSNKLLYQKMISIKNHGIQRKNSNKKKYYWSYIVTSHGYNYRLSDINCALGYSQIKRLNKFIIKRNKIAILYNELLKKNIDVIHTPKKFKDTYSAWHLYIININFKKLRIKKEKLIKLLFEKYIITQVHYIPTYLQPVFRDLKKHYLNGSKKYFEASLSLPIYYELSIKNVKYIAKTLNQILEKYKN